MRVIHILVKISIGGYACVISSALIYEYGRVDHWKVNIKGWFTSWYGTGLGKKQYGWSINELSISFIMEMRLINI